MDKASAKDKIITLSREIETHNQRYYQRDAPTISDVEYDALLNELVALENLYPQWKFPDSPSQRVGAKLDVSPSAVRHSVPMLSLDNTYSLQELRSWYDRIMKGVGVKEAVEFVAELKIDGVSASMTYENGLFVLGATRGDGTMGENITANLKTVRSLPLRLRSLAKDLVPLRLDVRAEIFMSRRDFEIINQKRIQDGEAVFVNPRNAASGTVKLLDSRTTANRPLGCFVHSFGQIQPEGEINTHWGFLRKAEEWGLPVNPLGRLCRSFEEIEEACRSFEAMRNSLPYETDGVVVKVNDLSQQVRLGMTSRSPRWAVAYKFQAHQATTSIQDIIVQVGRTGVLTPVAVLKPVACAGVTIMRATLHNFDEVSRLGIQPGDQVLVERAGDVIPKIVRVVEPGERNQEGSGKPPQVCPSCQSPVVKDQMELVAYRCVNPLCPSQLERKLAHFASRGAMDIDGLGEAVIRQLLQADMVKDPADLYDLTEDQLVRLELFKEKKARNLLKSISMSRQQPLSRLVFGLGIAHIGQKAASVLALSFGQMDRLMIATEEELATIEEVGPIMAASVGTYFRQSTTKVLIERLKAAGLCMDEPIPLNLNMDLQGKTFIFTGELQKFVRREAAQEVSKRGGKVVSSLSRKTDYLVAGDRPGSKFGEAQKLGITILTEDQFEELLHG